MKNENFTYSFDTTKTPNEIFNLLLKIPEWWYGVFEETIEGKSQRLNDEFTFRAGGGAHYTKQQLTELIPDKKVVWKVTESNLSFLSDPEEWRDTKFSFELSPGNGSTHVTFTHEGLVPEVECYDACSSGWTQYLERFEKKLQ